jgi:hypothetical protein
MIPNNTPELDVSLNNSDSLGGKKDKIIHTEIGNILFLNDGKEASSSLIENYLEQK